MAMPTDDKDIGVPSSEMNTPIGKRADQGLDRWIVWVPVFLGLGIGVYFALSWEPSPATGAAALLGGLAAVLALRSAGTGRLCAWAVMAVAVGFAAAQLRTHQVAAPVIAERLGPLTVEGRIVSVEPLPKGSRVLLDRLRITRLDANRVPERVRVRLNGEQPALRPGKWVRLRAVLSPPPAPPAPGAFDFQRQAFFQRLGGVGFGMGGAQLLEGEPPGGWERLELAIEGLRQEIDQRIRTQIPGDTGSTVSAMVTGLRGGISESTMEDVRDSGLAHLLAISGLNIGLAAAMLFVLARSLLALVPSVALRHPIKKWAAVLAFAGAGAYAVIAGITVPTQRAFLMIAIALVAVLYDRRALSMRLVAVAADRKSVV
jgi:competence protein ComEC